MREFLLFAGLAALVLALVAAIKGSLPPGLRISHKQAAAIMAASFVVLLAGAAMADPLPTGTSGESESTPSPVPSLSAPPDPVLSPSPLPIPSPKPSPIVRPPSPQPPARPGAIPPEAQEAVVVRHVDGDTIWAEGGTLPAAAVSKIRLLEIDTPESGDCFSPEASAFLRAELPIGSKIYLLADKDDKDQYGRFLRYIWKPNGEFFNDKAVRQGFAKAVLYAPNDRYISQMRAAEAEAKSAKRGLWAACQAAAPAPVPPPPVPQAPVSVPVPVPPPAAGCDASYPDFCIPPGPPDLDCADVSERRFTVLAPDPHGFDGNKDGVGCQSD